MAMKLSRRADGAILNNGSPLILFGGHYALFYPEGGTKAYVDTTSLEPVKEMFPTEGNVNPQGCPAGHTHPTVKDELWGSNICVALDSLHNNRGNLFRVFLTDGIVRNGNTLITIYPFLKNAAGKWRVKEAVTGGKTSPAWNTAYFNLLADFATRAEERNVAVLLSLFNHFDFRGKNEDTVSPFTYFATSYFNPGQIDDPAYGVRGAVGTDESLRNHYFMDLSTANANVLAVQKAFVERVLFALCPRPNVFLEIMNEPRGVTNHATLGTTSSEYVAQWNNRVTGWIIDWLRANTNNTWRPLISVNASFANTNTTTPHDVDAWAAQSGTLTQYKELDLITYHGISGRRERALAACGGNPSLPFIDKLSIDSRPPEHRGKHPTKAMMYSTDGVHQLGHPYPLQGGGTTSIGRRDGQIITSVPNTGSGEANDRIASDLDNWAYWCFTNAFDRANNGRYLGTIHFQNHSSNLPSFMVMKDVYSAVEAGQPVPPQPVCNRGRWVTHWAKVTGGGGNFWWAHNAKGSNGGVVNQFGTVANPAQASAEGTSAIGFRYDITPVISTRFKFTPEYSLVSLSENESAPQSVIPRIIALVCEVDTAGNIATQLARAEQLLSGGPRIASLSISADLVGGRRYAVIIAAEIFIFYQNRGQQYGEIIVNFPRMQQIDPR